MFYLSDEEWQSLHKQYLYCVVEFDNDADDPPDYKLAADVVLRFLQKYCTHPIRFYEFQLDSLAHLLGGLHATTGTGAIPLAAFQEVCLKLLRLCNEGQLSDSRVRSN